MHCYQEKERRKRERGVRDERERKFEIGKGRVRSEIYTLSIHDALPIAPLC